jgi:hypothetical protein
MDGSCATSGCMHGNLHYFERGGVGSHYCSKCYIRVLEGENRSLRAQLARPQRVTLSADDLWD